jgi:transposase-like protein
MGKSLADVGGAGQRDNERVLKETVNERKAATSPPGGWRQNGRKCKRGKQGGLSGATRRSWPQGPKNRPTGVRASVVARKRVTSVEPRDAGRWKEEEQNKVPSWHRLSGMNTKKHGRREEIRYSEAFKMEVVRELEMGGIAFEDISMKYGIKGKGTVSRWVRQYGNGTRGKVIRVESPGEINELKRLKARVRQLESALADANIDAALERAYTRLACRRAGIADVAGFKKKAAGQPGMKP